MDGFHYAVTSRTHALVQLPPGLIDRRTFFSECVSPLSAPAARPAAFIPPAPELPSRGLQPGLFIIK